MPDGRAAVGARIRELRERAGLKGQELAQEIGLDPSAISNIESGKRSVKTDELVRIAAALRVSPIAILEPDSLLGRLAVAARAAGAREFPRDAHDRLTALAELHDVLASEGQTTAPDFDGLPSTKGLTWREEAETLAQWACERLSVTATGEQRFAALVEAIEDELVVDVVVDSILGDSLAGASLTDPEFPLILINMHQPRSRALFTLGHELGHVLARDGALNIDDLVDHGDPREKFANAFAASFLMPEVLVRAQLQATGRTAATIATLMDQLGVSFDSLIWRLQNLRELSPAKSQALRRMGVRQLLGHGVDEQLSRRILGRLGTTPERRPPGWLATRAYHGFRSGAISIRPLAQLLDIDADELLDQLSTRDQKGEGDALSAVDNHPLATTDDERFAGVPVEPSPQPEAQS